MGNCCGIRSDYLDIARDDAKEKNDFLRMCQFDWNKIKKSEAFVNQEMHQTHITVEEMLMMSLTNDNAEFATPQVAHIAFSEFKKFMFLNKKFIEDGIKKAKAEVKEGEKYEEKSTHVGLFAPPVLDNIWLALISLNVPYGML